MTTTAARKNTYKYHFKNGTNRVVHRDCTNDLVRREREHQVHWPDGHIVQIGKVVTRESGEKWLRAGGRAGPPRDNKKNKQATKADLKGEVERLTKSEAVLGQENKDLENELEKVIAELTEAREHDVGAGTRVVIPLSKVGESGSPFWLYQWHRFLAVLHNAHPCGCSIDRFVNPNGRYFDQWNCKKGG